MFAAIAKGGLKKAKAFPTWLSFEQKMLLNVVYLSEFLQMWGFYY